MTTIPLSGAWRQGRAARQPAPRRTPVLLRVAAWAGRTLPTWKRARTAVMQWGAFTAGDVALWGLDWRAGLGGVFVSLLVLEALGGDSGERR